MSEFYTKGQIDAQAAVTGNRIKVQSSGPNVKAKIIALPDTNFMTDAEQTKLAGLEPDKFHGTYANLGSIPTVGAIAGSYAHIDAGVGQDVILANFDVNDDK